MSGYFYINVCVFACVCLVSWHADIYFYSTRLTCQWFISWIKPTIILLSPSRPPPISNTDTHTLVHMQRRLNIQQQTLTSQAHKHTHATQQFLQNHSLVFPIRKVPIPPQCHFNFRLLVLEFSFCHWFAAEISLHNKLAIQLNYSWHMKSNCHKTTTPLAIPMQFAKSLNRALLWWCNSGRFM